MYPTDAHALHAILTSIEESGAGTLHLRWSDVLGAEVNTPEFVKRHAEVVGLYQRTLEQIEALPEKQRQNYGPWRVAWWDAIIAPNVHWGDGKRAKGLDPSRLALLHGAGDVIEAKLESSALAPVGGDLDELKQHVTDWVDMLTGTPSVLPNKALTEALVSQLRHVLWLIENVGLFGAASVAGAAQAAIGGMVLASPQVVQEHHPKWKTYVYGFLGALFLFNTGVDLSATAIGHAGDIATFAIEAAGQAQDSVAED